MEEAIHVGTESMGIFLYVQFFYEPKTFFKKKSKGFVIDKIFRRDYTLSYFVCLLLSN